MGRKFIDENKVSWDHESEAEFAKGLDERGIKFVRQVKYPLPSRFFRSHSWSSDFEFKYKRKKWIVDVKGWFKVEDRVKLSFVEYVHNIIITVVPYKTKQKNLKKYYTIDWSFLDGK